MSGITGRSFLHIRERDDDRDNRGDRGGNRDDLEDNRDDNCDDRARQAALLRNYRDRLETVIDLTLEKARQFQEDGAQIQKLASEGRIHEAEQILAKPRSPPPRPPCPGCDETLWGEDAIDVVNGKGTLCGECANDAIDDFYSLCTAAQNCAGVSLTQSRLT